MPELPEVETTRLSLLPHLLGRRIRAVEVRAKRLRTPLDTVQLRHALIDAQITALRRRAKYLLVDLDNDNVLLLHLGMSGRLSITDASRPLATHDHLVFSLDRDAAERPNGDHRDTDAQCQLRFNDPRRFGQVEVFPAAAEAQHPALWKLGPEPLDATFTALAMRNAASGSKRPIKNFLMDGHVVVGVGNIYACESLFSAGVHPALPAGRLSAARWRKLVATVQSTLRAAIEQGGTTIRDFANGDGQAGYFAVQLRVYGRAGQPCVRCHRPIERIVQAGRSTFYCPRCQKR